LDAWVGYVTIALLPPEPDGYIGGILCRGHRWII